MAQNTQPIFTLVPVVSAAQLTSSTTAQTRTDGVGTVGTDMILAFTAGANGAFLNKLRFSATASTPTTMGASVFHIYISSVTSGATTAANTFLWQEVTASAQNAASTSVPTSFFEVNLGFAIPASYTVLVGIVAQPSANTQWQCTVLGGIF